MHVPPPPDGPIRSRAASLRSLAKNPGDAPAFTDPKRWAAFVVASAKGQGPEFERALREALSEAA